MVGDEGVAIAGRRNWPKHWWTAKKGWCTRPTAGRWKPNRRSDWRSIWSSETVPVICGVAAVQGQVNLQRAGTEVRRGRKRRNWWRTGNSFPRVKRLPLQAPVFRSTKVVEHPGCFRGDGVGGKEEAVVGPGRGGKEIGDEGYCQYQV